jgi:hypothetical protein
MAINPPDAPGIIRFSFVAADCNEPGWETGSGRFAIRFVDVLADGYVWNDPATWQQRQIINAKLKLSHGDVTNYEVYTAPDDPGNILNPDPKIEVIAYESWDMVDEVARATGGGDHSLHGADAGFSELVFLTDFADSEVHYIELSMIPAPEPTNPGSEGLAAFYALDGDPNDSSGNGNDGTISNLNGGLGLDGSVWVDDPVRGTVISFNGTAEGAYVRAGEIPQMTLDNDFTWAFWAKHSAENTADNDIILGNRYNEDGVDFVPRQFIKFTPTKFEWHMNGNGDDNLEYDDIPADVWIHHAVVKAADQLTYYRNGIEASSGTFTQALDFPQPLYFGGDNTAREGENWAGLMSDVSIYNRALHAGEVMFLAGQRATPVDPGTEGLAAFYALENDVLDSSGNGNDGTVVGAATFVEGPADYGMAMDFDGESYVDCGSDASLNLPGPFSAAIWIRPNANSANTCPLSKADSGAAGWSWQLRWGWNEGKGTTMGWQFNAGGSTWIWVGELPEDEWSHIAASHDGATVTCYLNGEGVESLSMGAITGGPTAPLLIGSDGWRDDWIGAIDEVAIYGRALSDGEVRYLVGYRAPVDPGTENLVAYYPLDDDANDASGNNNHGTLFGNPQWVAGKIDGALDFDGTDDYVESGTNIIPGSGDFTIGLWLTVDSSVLVADDRAVLEQGPSDPAGDRIYLYSSTDFGAANGQVRVWSDPTGQVLLGPDIRGAGWKHLVLTRLANDWELYVDGTLYTTASNANSIPEGQLILGGGSVDGRYHFGQIDDVRIYNRALSEPEVRFIAGGR